MSLKLQQDLQNLDNDVISVFTHKNMTVVNLSFTKTILKLFTVYRKLFRIDGGFAIDFLFAKA
jgi:hypothetical protein